MAKRGYPPRTYWRRGITNGDFHAFVNVSGRYS